MSLWYWRSASTLCYCFTRYYYKVYLPSGGASSKRISFPFRQVSSLAEDLSDDKEAIGGFALGGISNDDLDNSNHTDMADDDDDDGDAALELVHVNQDFFYMEHVMRLAALLHSLVSLAMLIAYYHLKVPLAIFKREKEIARRLEFDGLYIVEQPEDDDIKSHWDKLVISAKYVTRDVIGYDFEQIRPPPSPLNSDSTTV